MFVVIEGLDGAGKSTQVAQLKSWLVAHGLEYEYLHFPRFSAPVYGDLIARFLRGEFGALDAVSPRLVALIYAGDRAEAAEMIRGWLAAGKVVILDRYVYSNVAYQCAKCDDLQVRDELMRWIVELEYEHYGIPRADVSLFLDVPFRFTERSLSTVREGDDRDYLNGKQDIHEADLAFQRRVREVYLACAAGDASFKVVDCAGGVGGDMLSIDQIFNKIINEIKPFV